MLYPLTIIEDLDPDQVYTIDPGCLVSFPLVVGENDATVITAVHAAPTYVNPDHSIRTWVSEKPGGTTIAFSPITVTYWHPNRIPNERVIIHDKNVIVTLPNNIPVSPGVFYINMLNLVNQKNVFTCSLTPYL